MKPAWWRYAEFALGIGVTVYKAVTCALFGHDYANIGPDGEQPRCMWCGRVKR